MLQIVKYQAIAARHTSFWILRNSSVLIFNPFETTNCLAMQDNCFQFYFANGNM